MKHIAIKSATAALLAALAATTPLAFAQANAPSWPQVQYGLQSLDASSVRTDTASIDATAVDEPGPYARYLILNGTSREDALKAARNIDEHQRTATPRAIARWSGNAIHPGDASSAR